jgi:predicted Zn-dependent protease
LRRAWGFLYHAGTFERATGEEAAMSDAREEQFKKLVASYPQSPMGHFSLGKLYLEQRRYAEASTCLEEAVRLQPDYAAALVSLGDAYVGAKDATKARATLTRAKEVALEQNHAGLAEEIEGRLSGL